MGLFMKNRAMPKETSCLELRRKASIDRFVRNEASTEKNGIKLSCDLNLLPENMPMNTIRKGKSLKTTHPQRQKYFQRNKNKFAIPIEIEYTCYC
jgi:hypothetical protein